MPSLLDRFLNHVDLHACGCWLWTGQKSHHGYGRFRLAVQGKQRRIAAHRWLYEEVVESISADLSLDHLCRNPTCVNPDHLEPVSIAENIRRGFGIAGRNLRKTHCDHGHEFSEENTYLTPNGRRNCRACRRAAGTRYRLKVGGPIA